MHKWVLVTHRLTSNLSMDILENTENDRQIDHRLIVCCVIALSIGTRNLLAHYAVNPLNMGMFMIFHYKHVSLKSRMFMRLPCQKALS